MYLDMGLETLDSKFRELRVRELTARLSPPSGKPIPVVLGEGGGVTVTVTEDDILDEYMIV